MYYFKNSLYAYVKLDWWVMTIISLLLPSYKLIELGPWIFEAKLHYYTIQINLSPFNPYNTKYPKAKPCLMYHHHHFRFSPWMPNPTRTSLDTLQLFILPYGGIISFPMILVLRQVHIHLFLILPFRFSFTYLMSDLHVFNIYFGITLLVMNQIFGKKNFMIIYLS